MTWRYSAPGYRSLPVQMRGTARSNDGFGWIGLWQRGTVSPGTGVRISEAGGAVYGRAAYRSHRAADMAIASRPQPDNRIHCVPLIWDADKALTRIREVWRYFSSEEMEELKAAFKGQTIQSTAAFKSEFAKWSAAQAAQKEGDNNDGNRSRGTGSDGEAVERGRAAACTSPPDEATHPVPR